MRKLQGLKWKELTSEEQEKLYFIGFVDKDNVDDEGNGIVDFGEDLAIEAKVVYGEEQEIIIDGESVLYDPRG